MISLIVFVLLSVCLYLNLICYNCFLPFRQHSTKQSFGELNPKEINNVLPKEKEIMIRQIKYLNNLIEQEHRPIKRITSPMMGFKAFASAAATLAGIELQRMLKKGQNILDNELPAWKQFYALAG